MLCGPNLLLVCFIRWRRYSWAAKGLATITRLAIARASFTMLSAAAAPGGGGWQLSAVWRKGTAGRKGTAVAVGDSATRAR